MGVSAFYEDEITLDFDEELLDLFNALRSGDSSSPEKSKRKRSKNSGEGLRKIEMYLEEKRLKNELSDEFDQLLDY